MPSLCRACCHAFSKPQAVCPACASVRVMAHDTLLELGLAHLDCDAFFAAVEKRDAPELRSRPVIVGGGRRGVVATCCYIARLSGVRSAMPIFKALRLCPDAVVIRPDFEKYRETAAQIRARMLSLTPLVETVSIDEAYLDLSGTQRLHGAPPAVMLARLARGIESELGITVSIGLSANKFLAKTASEMDKPRGFAVIAPGEARDLLAGRCVDALHGVGPKLARRLARDGLARVCDLQALGTRDLMARYGETGRFLHARAHGEDSRPVSPDAERKSVSSETTFDEDIADGQTLEDVLWLACERTAARAKSAEIVGGVITLKLRRANFRTLTRRVTLSRPTHLAGTLFRAAQPLLAREAMNGTAFRLLGVGLSDLSPAEGDPDDLIDPRIAKRAAAERASDAARARFGPTAVESARALRYRARRTGDA